jgi:integration host factor subunit alpha
VEEKKMAPPDDKDKKPKGIEDQPGVSRAETTITRIDLAAAVYKVIGTTRTEAAALVDAVIDRISEKICAGETVKLHNFGKFVVRHKDKREGRNPRTLEPAEITERHIVQFRASPAMKQKLNGTGGGKVRKKKKLEMTE